MSRSIDLASRLALCALVSGLLLSAAGCQLPPPVYVVDSEPAPEALPAPPPAPFAEEISQAPSELHVWQPGYWHWDTTEYSWVPGSWLAPRPGFEYVPADTYVSAGIWHYRPCFWRRPRHGRGGRAGHHRRPGAELARDHAGERAHRQAPAAARHPRPPIEQSAGGGEPAGSGRVHTAPPSEPRVHTAPPSGPTVHTAPPSRANRTVVLRDPALEPRTVDPREISPHTAAGSARPSYRTDETGAIVLSDGPATALRRSPRWNRPSRALPPDAHDAAPSARASGERRSAEARRPPPIGVSPPARSMSATLRPTTTSSSSRRTYAAPRVAPRVAPGPAPMRRSSIVQRPTPSSPPSRMMRTSSPPSRMMRTSSPPSRMMHTSASPSRMTRTSAITSSPRSSSSSYHSSASNDRRRSASASGSTRSASRAASSSSRSSSRGRSRRP